MRRALIDSAPLPGGALRRVFGSRTTPRRTTRLPYLPPRLAAQTDEYKHVLMTAASVSSYDLPSRMVSQPAPRALTVRGPASVTSRSTNNRRHRGHRSHHGGSSYAPQNEFPNFAQTGDVEIVISADGQERRYMLHRLILSQCSGFFEAGTSEEWARAQAQTQARDAAPSLVHRRGLGSIGEDEETVVDPSRSGSVTSLPSDRPRWRYELEWESSDDEMPMLVQKPPSSSLFGGDPTPRPPPVRNKPPAPSTGFFRSMANLSALHSTTHLPQLPPPSDTIRDYDNLFRIFYNYPPALDAVNIASTYLECKSLLTLADMYDALEVVGPRIDHHLLQFQSRLWKQIAKYPPSYLKLGYLARSRVIYSEALIHVVGQWPSGSNALRQNLPSSVIEIIEDKVQDLEDLKMRIDAKLFRLTLTNARGERVTPSNNYLDWLALSLFRQWLAENTAPLPPPPRPPSNSNTTTTNPSHRPPSTNVYRLLHLSGQSYLPHDELKRFLKLRPEDYTRDALKRFEKRMEEIKALARDVVRPLMRCELQLETGGGGVGYAVCTRVGEEDLGWD